MNRKRIAWILAVFLAGYAAGAFTMDWLAMVARPTERWALSRTMQMEQEARARRAAREGDLVRSLAHRWNVVALESNNGLEILGDWEDIHRERFQPVVLLLGRRWLERQHSEESRAKAARMFEALARSRLSSTLAELGLTEEAAAEADLAADLARSCQCMKWTEPASFAEVVEEESAESYVAVERYLLGQERQP